LRPASDYSRRTSASLTCRRGRRPPHEPDHFLQTEWDLTVLIISAAAWTWLSPRFRRIESELPDAVPDRAEAAA